MAGFDSIDVVLKKHQAECVQYDSMMLKFQQTEEDIRKGEEARQSGFTQKNLS